MDVSQCQLLEEKAGEGKAAKAARLLFGPPAAPRARKGPRTGPAWGSAWLMQQDCAHHLRGRWPGQLHPRDHHSEYSRAKWH